MTTNHHKQKLRYLLLALLLLPTTLQAQELSVKSFSEKTSDISASTAPRVDNNAIPCALVKVQIAAQGVKFEGNIMGNLVYNMCRLLQTKTYHPEFITCK